MKRLFVVLGFLLPVFVCAQQSKFSAQDYRWLNVGSAGFTAHGADFTSLAFSPAGTLYLAFKDWANTNSLTVMKFEGNSWSYVGTPGFSTGASDF